MATCIAGILGSVTFPSGVGLKSRAWSLEITQDANDCSAFASTSDWAEVLAGQKRARGSVSGYLEFDAASTAPGASAPAVGSFTLTATTGCTYAFSAVITRYSIGHSIDGNLAASIDFVVNGVVTEVWDVTP